MKGVFILRAKAVERVVKLSFISGYAVTQPFAFYIDAQPIIQEKFLAEHEVIQYGKNSEIVRYIQYKLTKLGHYEDAIDGVFGLLTEHAVKGFQSAYQLNVTGQVDQQTMETMIQAERDYDINKIRDHIDDLNEFSPTEQIRDVQEVLFYYGYYQGSIDGIYGPLTKGAIEHLKNIEMNEPNNEPSDNTSQQSQSNSTIKEVSVEDPTIVQLEVKNDMNPLIDTAKAYLGTPYVWGGTSPDGFDCSGFIQFVFQQHQITIPRTVNEIWNFSTPIESPSIGDLVFFETYQPGPSHLGIYLGNGNFIHAGSSKGVTISNFHEESYWKERFLGAKRIYQ